MGERRKLSASDVPSPGDPGWDAWVTLYRNSVAINRFAVTSAREALAVGLDEAEGAAMTVRVLFDLDPVVMVTAYASAVFELAKSVTPGDAA